MAIFVGYYPQGADWETAPQGIDYTSVYRATSRGEQHYEFVTHPGGEHTGKPYDEGDVVPLANNPERRVYGTDGWSYQDEGSYVTSLRRESVLDWVGVFNHGGAA